jgi:hypothetical protein
LSLNLVGRTKVRTPATTIERGLESLDVRTDPQTRLNWRWKQKKCIHFLSHLKIHFLKDVEKYSCKQSCFQIGSRMILLSKVWCRQWNKVDLTIWFCPWLKSSGSIFQTFFCLEYKLRNVFFKNFDKFKKRVPNFWLRAKMENRKGGEKQWERYRREWNF